MTTVEAGTKMRPSELLALHRQEVRQIVESYGVLNPRVFGSVAKGTDDLDSDLDLMVTVPRGSALRFLALSDALSEYLGIPVDVVADDAPLGSIRTVVEELVPL